MGFSRTYVSACSAILWVTDPFPCPSCFERIDGRRVVGSGAGFVSYETTGAADAVSVREKPLLARLARLPRKPFVNAA
jgi:hypothetical protein